jgi:hypothetical protein
LVTDKHCTIVAAWAADALILEDPPANNYNLIPDDGRFIPGMLL